MRHRLIVGCAAFAVGCGGWTGTGRAQSAATRPSEPAPTQQELLEQVQALRAEVKELREQVKANQPAMNAPATSPGDREAAIKALRQQIDQGPYGGFVGLNAGYLPDKGFVIRSDDGAFLLHPWAFVQVRDAANYRQHGATSPADFENGFELPRMKLILDGNVFSKDLTYQFIWATSDTTGNLGLQDAWVRYHLTGTPLAIEAGNIRDPADHESYLFATHSLTPDRSIVNNVLLNGDNIVKGAELSYGYDDNESVGGKVGVTSGERNSDTNFQNYPNNPASWGLVARLEWKVMGNWGDYAQFTALHDAAPLLVFGAGADYTEAGAAAALTHVADVQFDLPDGLGLYAAYLGRYTRHDEGSPATNGTLAAGSTIAPADTYDSTVRLQASYLVGQRFEPFARYEYLYFDPREFAGHPRTGINDVTLGVNYYLYGQRAKFTVGATYLPNGSPVANTISDLLAATRGSEFIVQAQFQLML